MYGARVPVFKKKPTFIKASRFRMNFLIYGARGERPSGEDRLLTPAPSGASSLCEYGRVNAVHPRFGSIFAHWWVTFLNRPSVVLPPSPFVALEMPRLTFDCCQFHSTLLDSSVTLIPGRIPKKKTNPRKQNVFRGRKFVFYGISKYYKPFQSWIFWTMTSSFWSFHVFTLIFYSLSHW